VTAFSARQRVRIVACEDDPRAVGRTGRIVDEVPPGELTASRWTVHLGSFLIGPILCHPHELKPID
jgi:hypothetical protein